MRIHLPNKKSCAKISLLLIASLITSCNSLKRVDDNEMLVAKNTILVDSLKITDEIIESLIIQKPNSDLLGYNLRLNIYNLAKVDPETQYKDWLLRKPKRKDRLTNLLSEKQVNRLGESFMVKGLSEWLKNVGEPPAVLDTLQTQRSLGRLRSYYGEKGYFNNTTTFSIDSLKRKQRVGVNYKVTLGEPYMLDSVSHNITSSAIDSIYNLVKKDSYVKAGQQFDLQNFTNERKRLTSIFRDRGVWNFQESAISYDMISDTTRIGNDRNMDIKLQIEDLKTRTENSITTSEYTVFKFDNINIYTDYNFDESDRELKFERFGNYTVFYRDKLRFKPETLTNAVYFEKDSVYSDTSRSRTLRQISSLNVFKYPTLIFEEDSTRSKLTANIYLAERPKYSFSTNLDATQSNIQKFGIAFSPSLQWRNLFKGAENLSLSGRLNVGSSREDIVDKQFFNLLEYGADLKLDFPRIWFPLINTKKFIPNYMLPRTSTSLGFSSQKNIGLDKRTFNGILGYNWAPTNFTKNNVELFNVQYVKNVNEDRFFNVYRNTYNRLNAVANDPNEDFINNPILTQFFNSDNDLIIPLGAIGFIDKIDSLLVPSSVDNLKTVRSISEREKRLTENNLIFTSNYTFNKNNRKGPTDNNFYQFRFKFESAGNFLSALSYIVPFKEDDRGLLILDVPYSQYLKTEYDYVKYWDLSKGKVLAFHSFLGIAIPYGNSENIPFVRSYFGGGSNDNRAWRPYSLGPGSTDVLNDFNEANLKIALNLEYRFPITGNFKGALFADAGNIWNVFDNVDDPEATFNGLKSLKDIALGSGFGIRYDFTYFVLRGDLGFKTYNPAEESSKRWFRDYNFSNSVLQIGINYPF